MTSHGKIERIVLDESRLATLRENIVQRLEPEDCRTVLALIDNVSQLWAMLDNNAFEVKRLVKMLFGFKSEKRSTLKTQAPPQKDDATQTAGVASVNEAPVNEANGDQKPSTPTAQPKRKGHGRIGVEQYTGATHVTHSHPTLKPGDPCPDCVSSPDGTQGRLYENGSTHAVCFRGGPPLQATVHRMQELRCNTCGKIYPTSPPEEASGPKYNASATATSVYFKYNAGVPFDRLSKIQKQMGHPVPAGTLSDLSGQTSDEVQPIVDILHRLGAQSEQFFIDDTGVKILELMKENKKNAQEDKAQRTGLFTTTMICVMGAIRIALFVSGREHAGENMSRLMKLRDPGLSPPTQMCDAAKRNLIKNLMVILANCLVHGRRKFVDIYDYFSEHCDRILDVMALVYKNEHECIDQGLDPHRRLAYHQAHSGPAMGELYSWMKEEIDKKRVEEHSALGKAFQYMINHWEGLTLFLRHPGAPLDNNICERAVKVPILNRKNAYFYKTKKGAQYGDNFMTLIHTCQLNNVNPVDYLTQLLSHPDDIKKDPANWLPWNYRQTLEKRSKKAA